MKKDKKINIFVPTYNSENKIKKSILSILKQSHRNFSLTIIDNCSTDRTIEIINKIKDKRLKIIKRKKNFGVLNNLNYAFKITKGNFAAVYHSNDIYHKDILKKQLNVLKKNPDIKITFTNATIEGVNGKLTNVLNNKIKDNVKYDLRKIMILLIKHYNFFVCQSVFFRPYFYKKHIKNWRYEFGMSSDLDLWLRFIKKTDVIFLKDALVKTTIGKGQVSYDEKNKLGKADFFKVINYHIKKNKINLNQEDRKNLFLLNQRDIARQVINSFIKNKYEKSIKLSKNLNLLYLFINFKISKKIILILIVKILVNSSFLIGRNLLKKTLIFLNEKYIT